MRLKSWSWLVEVLVEGDLDPPAEEVSFLMLTQRGGFLSLIKVRMSLKVAEVSWRSMALVRSGAESYCNSVPLSSADFYH